LFLGVDATVEGGRHPGRWGGPIVAAAHRWEVLLRVGDYVAGELSGEEARETERFVLGDAEGWRLAEAYARMLALLGAAGREPPSPPEAIAEYAVRRATDEAWIDPREVGEGHMEDGSV
jgi:anti-sigma-K factor RskA